MKIPGDKPAASGRESARGVFAELYGEYLPKVFRYVSYKVNGNTLLAEDLTSDIFEKALAGFSRYRSDKASFSTWLFSIARNTVTDYYRMNSRRSNVPLEKAAGMLSEELSHVDEVIRQEEYQRLQLCMAGLSHEEQEIISLKFSGELTNRRIAGMMSLSESNVGVKLYRAISKLRNCFREWQNGQGS